MSVQGQNPPCTAIQAITGVCELTPRIRGVRWAYLRTKDTCSVYRCGCACSVMKACSGADYHVCCCVGRGCWTPACHCLRSSPEHRRQIWSKYSARANRSPGRTVSQQPFGRLLGLLWSSMQHQSPPKRHLPKRKADTGWRSMTRVSFTHLRQLSQNTTQPACFQGQLCPLQRL